MSVRVTIQGILSSKKRVLTPRSSPLIYFTWCSQMLAREVVLKGEKWCLWAHMLGTRCPLTIFER